MDLDGMNRAKMRAEAALTDATGLLYVMLEQEVTDLDDLKALRGVVRQDAARKGLVKPTSLNAEPTVAEQINGGALGTGEVSISARLDVVKGDDNNDTIPPLEEGEEELEESNDSDS